MKQQNYSSISDSGYEAGLRGESGHCNSNPYCPDAESANYSDWESGRAAGYESNTCNHTGSDLSLK